MSLDYNEKNITLAKNLRKMRHRKKIICGTTFWQNTKCDFNAKKQSTILLQTFIVTKQN